MRKQEMAQLSIHTTGSEIRMILILGSPDEDFLFGIPPTDALRVAEELIRAARRAMGHGSDPSA